jgi:hypothetical protein
MPTRPPVSNSMSRNEIAGAVTVTSCDRSLQFDSTGESCRAIDPSGPRHHRPGPTRRPRPRERGRWRQALVESLVSVEPPPLEGGLTPK